LDFEIFKSTKECFAKLKEDGYTIYGTVLDKEAQEIQNTKLKTQNQKVAFVFGNEHRGLTQEAVDMCDEKIYIPMKGMVQSLNLSVTAGICMWEYVKSLHTEN
jgi:tRNA G18 (ribose-2'-O)-methylase SpoU